MTVVCPVTMAPSANAWNVVNPAASEPGAGQQRRIPHAGKEDRHDLAATANTLCAERSQELWPVCLRHRGVQEPRAGHAESARGDKDRQLGPDAAEPGDRQEE